MISDDRRLKLFLSAELIFFFFSFLTLQNWKPTQVPVNLRFSQGDEVFPGFSGIFLVSVRKCEVEIRMGDNTRQEELYLSSEN